MDYGSLTFLNYNIPSNNRELQPIAKSMILPAIITYQVITGNYSNNETPFGELAIITYQVITGNYSRLLLLLLSFRIITYQVITGNYSKNRMACRDERL